MKGLEPSTFCMASRRSSQLSYIREGGKYSRPCWASSRRPDQTWALAELASGMGRRRGAVERFQSGSIATPRRGFDRGRVVSGPATEFDGSYVSGGGRAVRPRFSQEKRPAET